MSTTAWMWVIFLSMVGGALAVDLGLLQPAHSHKPMPLRRAIAWTVIWILAAFAFSGIIAVVWGQTKTLEFLTGFVVEKSLSIDNMFVFYMIFNFFKVAPAQQPRILKYGILGAIGMRLAIIFAGVELLNRFHWVTYLFGGILILTAFRMLIEGEKEVDPSKNPVFKLLSRFLPFDTNPNHEHFFLHRDGQRFGTSLLAALVIVEVSDLVFAVDSIPAVLAISKDPFIVFTSNVFAILGLRSLYFVLSGFIGLFRYLKYGLVIVLFFIGFKMLVAEIYHIPVSLSLAVIVVTIGLSMAASVLIKLEK